MAASMARVITVLNYHSIFVRNINHFKQFQSQNICQVRKTFIRSQLRTFVCKPCLQSPRTITHTRSEVAASVDLERNSKHAAVNETAQSAKSNQVKGSPLDYSEVGDVRIHGDSTEASVPYRRRVEREEWRSKPDDGASVPAATAKTLAMKIRRDLILKRKREERTDSHSSDENKEADQAIASKKKGLDSKGFRTLRHQVQDLRQFQEDTVASILYRSVIYNEGDLVAIDKPYGLPSHGGPGVVHSVDSLLPLLAKKLKLNTAALTPRLHPVHRLDKDTTGVMLLAKTEETAQRLHRMFVEHRVGKRYWLVTVGVPDPKEGIIDMPMVEREVAGLHRMGIKPDIGAVYKNLGKTGRGGGTRAVTNFRVISENGSAALLEAQPETGVKHQIRVHMALGMGCPILGDHKYSHHDRLAPQRLPMAILQSLGIRQAKARTTPMHLHAREIILPEFLDGRTLFISTRLPKFFEQNMKRLKLTVP